MANYESALNMPYDAWVKRQAALEDISPTELEKKLEIKPIRVNASHHWDGRELAMKIFNKEVESYDAVTDLREGVIKTYRFLGLIDMGSDYVISGTAIKRKTDIK